MTLLEDFAETDTFFVMGVAIFFPIIALYYFFRWAKNKTLVPLICVFSFLIPVLVLEPYDTTAIYGSNQGLAFVSLTIFSLAFIFFFITFLAAKVSLLRYSHEERMRNKKWYNENRVGFNFAFKTPILIPMIFILLWLFLSLIPASYISGSAGTFISAVWYFVLVFYIVWVVGLTFIWALVVGEKGVKYVSQYI